MQCPNERWLGLCSAICIADVGKLHACYCTVSLLALHSSSRLQVWHARQVRFGRGLAKKHPLFSCRRCLQACRRLYREDLGTPRAVVAGRRCSQVAVTGYWGCPYLVQLAYAPLLANF